MEEIYECSFSQHKDGTYRTNTMFLMVDKNTLKKPVDMLEKALAKHLQVDSVRIIYFNKAPIINYPSDMAKFRADEKGTVICQ